MMQMAMVPMLLLAACTCATNILVGVDGAFSHKCADGSPDLTPAVYEQGYRAYKDVACIPDYALWQAYEFKGNRFVSSCPHSPVLNFDVDLKDMDQLV